MNILSVIRPMGENDENNERKDDSQVCYGDYYVNKIK